MAKKISSGKLAQLESRGATVTSAADKPDEVTEQLKKLVAKNDPEKLGQTIKQIMQKSNSDTSAAMTEMVELVRKGDNKALETLAFQIKAVMNISVQNSNKALAVLADAVQNMNQAPAHPVPIDRPKTLRVTMTKEEDGVERIITGDVTVVEREFVQVH